jgi:hypothetical protein
MVVTIGSDRKGRTTMTKILRVGVLVACGVVAMHGKARAADGALGSAIAKAVGGCLQGCNDQYGRYVWTGSELVFVIDDAAGYQSCQSACLAN